MPHAVLCGLSPHFCNYALLLPKRTSLRQRMPSADEGFLDFLSYLLTPDPAAHTNTKHQHLWRCTHLLDACVVGGSCLRAAGMSCCCPSAPACGTACQALMRAFWISYHTCSRQTPCSVPAQKRHCSTTGCSTRTRQQSRSLIRRVLGQALTLGRSAEEALQHHWLRHPYPPAEQIPDYAYQHMLNYWFLRYLT
jgi:hypothetical protein